MEVIRKRSKKRAVKERQRAAWPRISQTSRCRDASRGTIGRPKPCTQHSGRTPGTAGARGAHRQIDGRKALPGTGMPFTFAPLHCRCPAAPPRGWRQAGTCAATGRKSGGPAHNEEAGRRSPSRHPGATPPAGSALPLSGHFDRAAMQHAMVVRIKREMIAAGRDPQTVHAKALAAAKRKIMRMERKQLANWKRSAMKQKMLNGGDGYDRPVRATAAWAEQSIFKPISTANVWRGQRNA